jgi:arylsulfatase A-like enzyme
LAVAGVLVLAPTPSATGRDLRPNFVVIVTDDQSIDTLQKMPNTRSLITGGGTKFTQAIISNPLCCPSRATIFTGNYSHTTGVYTNGKGGPGQELYGGYPAFFSHGNETNTVNYALDGAGYETGLFGKYLNHFDPEDILTNGVPQGWDEFHAFTGDNPRYTDYPWVDFSNGSEPTFIDNVARYSTFYAGDKALRFIDRQDGSAPFFAYFAPYGPHGPIEPAPGDRKIGAPRGVSFETPAYNEKDVSDKPAYIRRLSRFSANQRTRFAGEYDLQYAALWSVDEYVGAFVDAAPANTVFVFLSDNGVTWGDHRFRYKLVPYERSIHVPLIVAAPGAPSQVSDSIVSNADIAPTILEFAGVTGPNDVSRDGRSLLDVVMGSPDLVVHPEGILLEHLSYPAKHAAPSYCGVRDAGWMYVEYKGGFEELYDLEADPFELVNIAWAHPNRPKLHTMRARAAAICQPLPPNMDRDSFGT